MIPPRGQWTPISILMLIIRHEGTLYTGEFRANVSVCVTVSLFLSDVRLAEVSTGPPRPSVPYLTGSYSDLTGSYSELTGSYSGISPSHHSSPNPSVAPDI